MELLVAVLILILVAEFINGWTDAPNAIATVISTRALTPRIAIAMAAVLNIIGACTGTAVATTIGRDIVRPEALDLHTLAAAMIAVISWGLVTWKFGLPISKSHALIAGLAGAGLAVGGPSVLIAEGWWKVLLGLVLSTVLGAVASYSTAVLIRSVCADAPPTPTRRLFSRLQILSAAGMALSHGSNDGQKFMGIFTLALLLHGSLSEFLIPWWVIVLCAVTMGIGTSIGGMRIIRTMGYRVVPLDTYMGFAAETSATATILMASSLGVPLSTTHTIGMAIVGVGLAAKKRTIGWRIFRNILAAWLLTFPVCGALSYCIASLF